MTHIHDGMPLLTRADLGSMRNALKLVMSVPHSVLRLVALAREFRPTLIHSNLTTVFIGGLAARLAGVPHVWHVREFFADFPVLWRVYQWYIAALSDRIICVSMPVAAQFHPRIARKARVIHDGFPRDEFASPSDQRIRTFRQRFGLDGRLCIGVIGRIKMGRKGQDVFLRACARLNDRFHGARFVLIGSPFPGNEAHQTALTALARELGIDDRVVWTGDVSDIKAAMAALDVSVLPSAMPEPFGGVVIESMALGVPVVGTRIGGTVEQIEDGVTGILVPPNDPASLAAALERLGSDASLRAAMGRAARERYLKLFEFEPFYARVTDVYAELRGRVSSARDTPSNA